MTAQDPTTLHESFLSLPQGRIHCVQQGSGPALVLLHSNGCSWHEYEHTLPLLARRFRCVAFDLPGHGDTDPWGGHLSIEDYAQVTLQVMDALGLARAHVCGASVGGFICMALGLLAPARVESLAIVEAALRTGAEWRAQWPRIEAQFAFARQSAEEVAPRLRALTPELLSRWNIDRAKAGGWRMVDVMWAIRDYDAFGALARLQVPTAVVLGGRGPAIAGRERYERTLPGCRLRVIEDAGHFPMIDLPQAFAEAVAAGIDELSRLGP